MNKHSFFCPARLRARGLVILALLLSLGLQACATRGPDNPLRVAVFSTLGDDGYIENSQAPVFFWDREFDASGWDVDASVEQHIEDKLRSNDRVRVVSADRTPYRGRVKTARPGGGINPSLRFDGDDRESEDALLEWAEQAKAEQIIVVGTDSIAEFILDTGRRIEGYGFYQRQLLGTEREYAYAVLNLFKIDAENGRRLRSVQATEADRIKGFTRVEEDEVIPPERVADWRENVWPVIRRGIDEELDRLAIR